VAGASEEASWSEQTGDRKLHRGESQRKQAKGLEAWARSDAQDSGCYEANFYESYLFPLRMISRGADQKGSRAKRELRGMRQEIKWEREPPGG